MIRDMLAGVHPVLADRAARVGGDVLVASSNGPDAGAATIVVYSIAPAFFEGLLDGRDGRAPLLADRDVDACSASSVTNAAALIAMAAAVKWPATPPTRLRSIVTMRNATKNTAGIKRPRHASSRRAAYTATPAANSNCVGSNRCQSQNLGVISIAGRMPLNTIPIIPVTSRIMQSIQRPENDRTIPAIT